MTLPPELRNVRDHFHLLRDRVLVKRLEYRNKCGLFVAGVELQKGVVVAVGYGRRRRRKIGFKQTAMQGGRTIMFEDGAETGVVRPVGVKVGDVVEFSHRLQTAIDFERLGFPGAGELLVINEQAIMSIDPVESASEAPLWQRSAGFDKAGNFLSGAEDWQRA